MHILVQKNVWPPAPSRISLVSFPQVCPSLPPPVSQDLMSCRCRCWSPGASLGRAASGGCGQRPQALDLLRQSGEQPEEEIGMQRARFLFRRTRRKGVHEQLWASKGHS